MHHSFNKEYRICRISDHETRWVLGLGELQFDELGKLVLLIGTIQDVTERKCVEEERRLDEARMESLLRINQHPSDSIQGLLDFSLEEAIQLTDSMVGYIYFYDEDSGEFTLNSWSRDARRECDVDEPRTKYQLELTGLWGEAVRQRRAIINNEFEAPHPLKKGMPPGHTELHTFLTIPVFSEGRIVAVVGVGNKQAGYNDFDIRQLNLMMDSVWRIVQRIMAKEEIHRLNADLERAGR